MGSSLRRCQSGRPLHRHYEVTGFDYQRNSCIHTPVGNSYREEIFFRNVAYIGYDVTWFMEWIDFGWPYWAV
jgi:hypothetical protein